LFKDVLLFRHLGVWKKAITELSRALLDDGVFIEIYGLVQFNTGDPIVDHVLNSIMPWSFSIFES
tara:strand:+ start:750 stop:944 length:195 start_codon:yes stop_codon:yes gene_type:complete